jgi:hypothetical protein
VSQIVRDIKQRINAAVQTAIWNGIAGVAALVMFGFLCAALFVWLEHLYGSLYACLLLAGLFFLVAVVALLVAAGIRRREARLAELRARRTANMWRDPAMLSTGLQFARTMGLKRTAPVLVLGAAALGLVLSRLALGRRDGDDASLDE